MGNVSLYDLGGHPTSAIEIAVFESPIYNLESP
jgi:hypothetical protein